MLDNDIAVGAASLLTLLGYYAVARKLVQTKFALSNAESGTMDKKGEMKARSWLLSLFIAAVLSVVGVYYAAELADVYATQGSAAVYRLLVRRDPFGRVLTILYTVFMVCDLAVGVIDYRPAIDLMSGYVHHTVYIATCLYFLHLGYDSLLPCFSPIEWPTLMLAIGSVHKPWRQDLPMGVSFFLTRIVYFSALVLTIIEASGLFSFLSVTGLLIVTLHLYWMRGWFVSYAKRLKTSKTTAEVAAAAAVIEPSQQLQGNETVMV